MTCRPSSHTDKWAVVVVVVVVSADSASWLMNAQLMSHQVVSCDDDGNHMMSAG